MLLREGLAAGIPLRQSLETNLSPLTNLLLRSALSVGPALASPLSHLGWSDLATCRKIQKVLLCRRILRNQSIVLPSAYFSSPMSNTCSFPVSNTRSSPVSNTRSSTLKRAVSIPFARTKSFQSSFFVSVCHLWNSLPFHITYCPVIVCLGWVLVKQETKRNKETGNRAHNYYTTKPKTLKTFA